MATTIDVTGIMVSDAVNQAYWKAKIPNTARSIVSQVNLGSNKYIIRLVDGTIINVTVARDGSGGVHKITRDAA